jgi:nicotinate phosphoribosyltransferase
MSSQTQQAGAWRGKPGNLGAMSLFRGSVRMTPIITSLLDTDLYKFTMWQAMLHRFPQSQAEYRFVCRNTPAWPLARLLPELQEQLDALCALTFRDDELAYLRGLRFIKSDFVDFLRIFRFQRAFIEAWVEGDVLHVAARGPQVHVMAFEVFVLAIVNELYFRRCDADAALAEGRRRLALKVDKLLPFERGVVRRGHPLELTDFGTRRRFSAAWQREVVATLAQRLPGVFKGTSNVRLAKELGLVAIGTMAHEYLQTYQTLGCGCATSRRRRSRTGCRSTGATWASHSPT